MEWKRRKILKVVLDVTNVTKAFGNRVAVNNISFTLHEGEIFGFLMVQAKQPQ